MKARAYVRSWGDPNLHQRAQARKEPAFKGIDAGERRTPRRAAGIGALSQLLEAGYV
jgi:hypothetical protein